jgi:hypothetical protein
MERLEIVPRQQIMVGFGMAEGLRFGSLNSIH